MSSSSEDLDMMGGGATHLDDEVAQYFENDVAGPSNQESIVKPTRGPTELCDLGKKGFPPVEFDEHGRATGVYAGKFNKWVGIMARQKFDFTVENWRQFEKNDKLKVWQSIKVRNI